MDFQTVKDNMSAEIALLRKRQQELEQKNPILKERMTELTDVLKNDQVSEATYIDLKAIPETERSLRDKIMMRFFEIQQKYQNELEVSRRDAQTSR